MGKNQRPARVRRPLDAAISRMSRENQTVTPSLSMLRAITSRWISLVPS